VTFVVAKENTNFSANVKITLFLSAAQWYVRHERDDLQYHIKSTNTIRNSREGKHIHY